MIDRCEDCIRNGSCELSEEYVEACSIIGNEASVFEDTIIVYIRCIGFVRDDKPETSNIKVAYICDRKNPRCKVKLCRYQKCSHTTDIDHAAKMTYLGNGKYFEDDGAEGE